MTESKCPEVSTSKTVQQTGMNAETLSKYGTDLISQKEGGKVSCVPSMSSGLSSVASVEGAGGLQLDLLGQGGL